MSDSKNVKFQPESVHRSAGYEKCMEKLWELIRMVTFPCSLFVMRRWRVMWIKVGRLLMPNRYGCISWKSSIARLVRIDRPWNVSIAEHATVCNGVWLYALDRISIGRWASVGENVQLLTGNHDVDSSEFHLITKPIVIGDMAWVATNSIVLPGVTIGEGAVVGAGSVVVKDVDPWVVVAGNPAHFIKERARMVL